MWLKVRQTVPKETDKKLDIRWLGPCEILDHIIEGRYKISHPVSGEMEVHMDRLKPYMPTLEGKPYPLHYFAPKGTPAGSDDQWEVIKILGHKGVGEDMEWKVLWKAGDSTWKKKGQFVYGCQSDWLAYNKKNNLPVSISEVKVCSSGPPSWDRPWPVGLIRFRSHDLEREYWEDWDLPFVGLHV